MTHGRGGVPTQDRYKGPQPQKEVDGEHAKVSSDHEGVGDKELGSGRTCVRHARHRPSTAAGQHPRAGSPQTAAPSQRRQAASGVGEVRTLNAPAGLRPRAASPQAATASQR